MSEVVTADDVRSAAARLRGVAHRTPVVTSRTLDADVGAQVFLKCENLQRIGAFKFRGAYNAISRLSPAQLERGVVAWSSGNHAQAVALACRLMGSRAVIVVPQDTPAAKQAATQGYGAELVRFDRFSEDRVAIGTAIAAEHGMTIIPPYEHPHVMAGQGTAALELVEDVGPLDHLVVPVGGGGLAAGSATIAVAESPGVRVVGVEPADGDDTKRSLEAGHLVTIDQPRGLADGQAAEVPGEMTFAVNRRLLDRVVLVTDEQIVEAMRFAAERLKLVLEPSGATSLAAVRSGAVDVQPGSRVGVVLSGGNVDLARFAALIAP